MTKRVKPLHPADAALIAAFANADYFTASLFHDRQHITTPPLRTLEIARQAAAMLPIVYASSRKAGVYVVDRQGGSFFVPDTFTPPLVTSPVTSNHTGS